MRRTKKISKIIIAAAVIAAVTSVIVLLTMVTAKVYNKAPEVKRGEAEQTSETITDGDTTESGTAEIKLPILMYHNVIPSKAGKKYEVTVDDLRRDFEAIKASGFTVVSADSVQAYAAGAKIVMPEKPIMLTFDDGFYNYIRYLTPLLKEYGYTATVGVVGDFTRFNKNTSAASNYIYVDYDDILSLSESGVTIANHSSDLHYIRQGKKGVMPIHGESKEGYRKRFKGDTLKMHENLSKIGIKPSIYVYPYGLYNDTTEEVLTGLGYTMTFTCTEEINTVVQGDRSSIRLLGRYNRDGRKPVQALLDRFGNM